MGFNKKGKSERLSKEYYQKMCPQRELPIKEFEMDYALVEKNLGSLHYAVACSDGKIRLAVLRGRLRYKVYVNEGDIVLVGLRDYQDNKCDILLKYHKEEVKQLWQMKEIPDEFYSKVKHIFPFKCGSDVNSISSVNDSDIIFLTEEEVEEIKSRASSNLTFIENHSQNQSFSLVNGLQSPSQIMSDFDSFSINTADLETRSERSETTQTSDFEVLDI